MKTHMATEPSQRPSEQSVERTLQSLAEGHTRYVAAGSNLTNAKNFNNIIRPAILPIPLIQVSIPVLHLDLGIFPWMFTAFERELQGLDLKVAASSVAINSDSTSFHDLVEWHTKAIEAANHSAACLSAIDTVTQQLQYVAMFVAHDMTRNAEAALQQHIIAIAKEKEMYNARYKQLINDITKKAKSTAGPCQVSIEPVLQKAYVQRQVYYGGTLVGNHVKLALQPHIILSLVEASTCVICEQCPDLLDTAIEVQEVQEVVPGICCLTFSHCHKMDELQLSRLESNIADFMKLCRRELVERKLANITLKLHLLESHTLQSARGFKVGLGFLGEQGSESIHARDYNAITNKVDWLKAMAQQYLASTLPQQYELRPRTVTRKRKNLKKKHSKLCRCTPLC